VPTYQYACTACGHQLEAVQSFADEPLTECPACEGRLRKLFSSVGIVFKGSGFYRTDSRSAPSTDSTPGEKDGASKDTPAKDSGSTKDSASTKNSGSKDGSSTKESTAPAKKATGTSASAPVAS
jgi:putative FmdB family regulatory protein